MPIRKNTLFVNEAYYHVFNRGVDRRVTFTSSHNYQRALDLLYYYQFVYTPLRFSHYTRLNDNRKQDIDLQMYSGGKKVHVVAYCLMPNHYHLLIKQKEEKGISLFISEFQNAYTRYFNLINKRTGFLFQSAFKAVYVESDMQLLHLTRYIHLNPATANIISLNNIDKYQWSSYLTYIKHQPNNIVHADGVYDVLAQVKDYKSFVNDNAAYTKELNCIRHISLEE